MADSSARLLTRAAVIAAAYAALTVAFAPVSYGLAQVRVSEALVALAYFEPAAVPGLFVGVMIANIFGGNGPWDVFGGSLITLAASYMTWKIKTPKLALLPHVILNAIGIAFILNIVLGLSSVSVSLPVGITFSDFTVHVLTKPYALRVGFLSAVLMIGIGEAIAVYGLGYPLLAYLIGSRQVARPEAMAEKFGDSPPWRKRGD